MVHCQITVEHIATRRLVEASAALDPASRALLSLWLHRGLSNEVIAQLAGLETHEVAVRKLEMVRQLSRELELPPLEVLAALRGIVSPPRNPTGPVPAAPVGNGAAPADANGAAATAEPDTVSPPGDEPAVDAPEPGNSGLRRRYGLIGAAVLTAAIVAGVLLAVLPDHTSRPSVSPAPPAVTGTSSARVADGARQTLTPLSSRAPHARGAVSASRVGTARAHHLELNLTVSGLPTPRHGRYEVWLFNSIINARSLGVLHAGVDRLSLRLPGDAANYRAIDISLQPPGYRYDSGESVLRAKNPVR